MKIFITGNMGYVGPAVVRQLRRSYPDATLVGFDIGYFTNYLISPEVFPECCLDIQYFGDVRKFSKEILTGVDAVVHLAAISNDPMGASFEDVTFEINHRATMRVAKLARDMGVRTFVFASSCSVYGLAEDGARTETDPVNPLTAYAKSKVFTEQDLSKLADEAFKVTCLRFATACGMSERLRLDLVLNDFVASAITTKRINILSDGTPWRPLISVDNMARAIEWAITRKPDLGERFLIVNAGSDEWNFQVRELAETVAKIVPGTEIAINKNAQPDKRSYRVNFGLFRKLAPDHQPLGDLRTTVDRLSTGLKSVGFKDSDFRNSNLARLKVLQNLCTKGFLTQQLEWRNEGFH
jgi:nucleoside-diphosphate-sugar epimerase